MTLICMKMRLHAEQFSHEWFRTLTRFDTEAQGNYLWPIYAPGWQKAQ